MDRALRNELALERVRDQAKATEEELLQLQNWKVVTERKLKLAEEARDEHQRTVEELKAVLEDKEDELRLAKEKAVQEYRDSDALLTKTQSMLWGRSLRSSGVRIMRTWATTRRRPWGRRASSALPK